MEAKEAAKILYYQGVSQKDIAQILDKNEKTISTWVHDGKWDEKRTEHNLLKETSEEQVWKLINWQLRILQMITEEHENSINEGLDVAGLQKLLIGRGDIDALQKLFTTIKGKELEWSQLVKIIRELTEFIQSENVTLAKQLTPYANDFLNQKRQA